MPIAEDGWIHPSSYVCWDASGFVMKAAALDGVSNTNDVRCITPRRKSAERVERVQEEQEETKPRDLIYYSEPPTPRESLPIAEDYYHTPNSPPPLFGTTRQCSSALSWKTTSDANKHMIMKGAFISLTFTPKTKQKNTHWFDLTINGIIYNEIIK